MIRDIIRSEITAFGRIKRLARRILRADADGADPAGCGAEMREARHRLARQRASDARVTGLARLLATRRVEGWSAAICVAPAQKAARATMRDSEPRLDASVIGRHFRQVFPAAPASGVFDDLLELLEESERCHSLSPRAQDIAFAYAS